MNVKINNTAEREECQSSVLNVAVDDRALVELGLRDVDRFQRQKVKDLKDVFTNYAILQTEKYKKVSLSWISCHFSILYSYNLTCTCLQCFDTVGWTSGRAFGL